MKSARNLSVVIPILNEREILPELVSRVHAVLAPLADRFEIIFVDDGSSDGSLQVLLEIQASNPTVRIVELSRNFGQTAALAAGIDLARGDTIITMDGDLQHTPEDIPRFVEKLELGCDIVSGWRQVRTDSFFLRRIPSLLANRLMSWRSGIRIKDFGSTFKAYRSEIIKKVELFGELHRFIPVLAHRVGARIQEIPITVHPRAKGVSKYGLARTLGVFEDIIFLEFYLYYLTKPLRAFGKLAVIFMGLGFTISFGLMLAWMVNIVHAVIDHGALLLFSVFCMIVGVQFLVVGVLAELLTRIYHHTSGTSIYSIRKVHAAAGTE